MLGTTNTSGCLCSMLENQMLGNRIARHLEFGCKPPATDQPRPSHRPPNVDRQDPDGVSGLSANSWSSKPRRGKLLPMWSQLADRSCAHRWLRRKRCSRVVPWPTSEFQVNTNKESCFENAPASPCIPKVIVRCNWFGSKEGCFCATGKLTKPSQSAPLSASSPCTHWKRFLGAQHVALRICRGEG